MKSYTLTCKLKIFYIISSKTWVWIREPWTTAESLWEKFVESWTFSREKWTQYTSSYWEHLSCRAIIDRQSSNWNWTKVRSYSGTLCVFTLTEFWSTVTGNTLEGMELRNKRKFSWIDVSAHKQRGNIIHHHEQKKKKVNECVPDYTDKHTFYDWYKCCEKTRKQPQKRVI